MEYKPQDVINKQLNKFVAVGVFTIALAVYVLTLAQSLSFWDCGEYITCSSILGVPHPPGNPFYILLGRFFTALAGNHFSHTMIVNFMSAFFSSLAVMFTYLITVKFIAMWIKKEDAPFAYLTGFIAAMYIAFSFTFWSNAIEAEVYGGLAFFLNLIIYLTLVYVEESKEFSHQNYLVLIIYLFFLGFGVHQTVLQLAPAVLFIVIYPNICQAYKSKEKFWSWLGIYLAGLIILYVTFNQIGKAISVPDLSKIAFALGMIGILYYYFRDQVKGRTWLIALLLTVVAYSTHIFLLVRSAHRPFINEGYPHTMELFKDYVLRTQYGTTSFFTRNAGIWHQINHSFLRYFGWQFFHADSISALFNIPIKVTQSVLHALVIVLGLNGMIYQFKKNKHSFAYMLAFFLMASLAMVFVMNQKVQEVRDRDYFFVTAYNLWAIWMAIGSLGFIKDGWKVSKVLGYVLLMIALLLPVLNYTSQYWIHDRHKELVALGYGQNILNSLEENAIIFTNGDNDTFPVWYAQAVEDPYAQEFIWEAQDIEPTQHSRDIIGAAMQFKDSTLTGIRRDISVANLSLLNTPWYIKQLRDKEGVEFDMPDWHIDNCQIDQGSALYPRRLPQDTRVKIRGTENIPGFEIVIKSGEVLYVKDLAVIQIIKDNYGKRPIYFAVTVSETSGFGMHLRNEGMVDRLVPTSGSDQFDIARLTANIDSVYTYASIFDDTVYKDNNMLRLLNNYGAAFMRASTYYRLKDDYDNAIYYMQESLKFIQEKQRFYRTLASLYSESGINILDTVDQLPAEEKQPYLAEAYYRFENMIYYNRYNKDIPAILYSIALDYQTYQQSIDMLNKLISYAPDGHDIAEINKLIANLETMKNR
jgi:transmembrane protein TMEM260 (protein O-mannosyltransferase)